MEGPKIKSTRSVTYATGLDLASSMDATAWIRSQPPLWSKGKLVSSSSHSRRNRKRQRLSASELLAENASTHSSSQADDTSSNSDNSATSSGAEKRRVKHKHRRARKSHRGHEEFNHESSSGMATMPELVGWAKRVYGESLKIKEQSTQLVRDFDIRAKSFIELVRGWTTKRNESEGALAEAQTELTQTFQVPTEFCDLKFVSSSFANNLIGIY